MLQGMIYHYLLGVVRSQKLYLQDVEIKPEISKKRQASGCCVYKYAIDFLYWDI